VRVFLQSDHGRNLELKHETDSGHHAILLDLVAVSLDFVVAELHANHEGEVDPVVGDGLGGDVGEGAKLHGPAGAVVGDREGRGYEELQTKPTFDELQIVAHGRADAPVGELGGQGVGRHVLGKGVIGGLSTAFREDHTVDRGAVQTELRQVRTQLKAGLERVDGSHAERRQVVIPGQTQGRPFDDERGAAVGRISERLSGKQKGGNECQSDGDRAHGENLQVVVVVELLRINQLKPSSGTCLP